MEHNFPTILSVGQTISGFPDWLKPHLVKTSVSEKSQDLIVRTNGPFGLAILAYYEPVLKTGSRGKETRIYSIKSLKAEWHHDVKPWLIAEDIPDDRKQALGEEMVVSFGINIFGRYAFGAYVHVGHQRCHLYRLNSVILLESKV